MKRLRSSPIWAVTKEELLAFISKSKSVGQILSYFGLSNKGGNYKTLAQRCREDDIPLKGMFIHNMRKGALAPFYSLQDVLIENSPMSRTALKKRLIKEMVLPYKCAHCDLGPLWAGRSLSLVLDHVNGVSNDNRLENLRFLCPNCNSQTPTFAGRNSKKKFFTAENVSTPICDCGNKKTHASFRCSSCFKAERARQTKITWPTLQELQDEIEATNMNATAKRLGVSFTGLKKRIRKELDK